jgi:hypothetical protein
MTTPRIDPEMGILQLPGDEPSWIWAFTCPTRGCSCRSALVLTTAGDRETLRSRGAEVGEAWLRGRDRIAVAASLAGVTVFQLDLDSAEVGPPKSDQRFTPDDLAAQPELARVVERIDGEVLDAIGRLWYLGKGTPDPQEARREAPKIEIADWKAGQLVGWNEALLGARDDLYILDDGVFEASELYCVANGCTCGETVVRFAESKSRDVVLHLGAVRISGSGAVVVDPDQERDRARIAQLWTAFQHRHPRYRERFARRAATMQELGPKIVSAPAGRALQAPVTAAAKIGRNEPCPCGSGKKYKKCCGAS